MTGSSPLSRGIRLRACSGLLEGGIIPALAGNTFPQYEDETMISDHPRSRGEYHGQGYAIPARGGSSPLSRGILRRPRWLPSSRWIIPALAGNTAAMASRSARARDHPRSRGEYLWVLDVWRPVDGSSPLSRGILLVDAPRLGCLRIIPALAGNTVQKSPLTRPQPDHPRSRGEYSSASPGSPLSDGSSPLSRGIPRVADGGVE